VLRRRPRYRHAHRAGLSLGSVLAAAALIGCGGGDETTTRYPPGVARPIDKVEFLREADRICESTNARVEAAADDLVGGRNEPPPAEVRRIVLAIVIPALQTEVDAISSLGAPEGDERKVSAIIAAVEEGIDELRADPLSALDGPPPSLVRAGRLAAAYGSRACDVRQSG
jgi:hypothetical protein